MDKSSEAWKRVFEANPRIAKSIERDGLCEVTASQIKKFREPKLMTKRDSAALRREKKEAEDSQDDPVEPDMYEEDVEF
jgi:hypothetical protein